MDISFLKEKRNKYLIFLLLGLLGIVFLIPTSSVEETAEKETVYTSENELEVQLKRVLSAMEGVGEVEVMITQETSENSLFGTEESSTKICGVVVVAEGAGSAIVNTRILEAVKALFSIDAHKISIVKMKSQEEEK